MGRLSIELATLQVEDALLATLTLVTDYMDVFYACGILALEHIIACHTVAVNKAFFCHRKSGGAKLQQILTLCVAQDKVRNVWLQ